MIASSNTPPLVTGSYNLTRRRPSSAVGPGRSARGFTSTGQPVWCCLAALEADATATVQAPARRTEIKTVILKLSDNRFHQEPHDLTH